MNMPLNVDVDRHVDVDIFSICINIAERVREVVEVRPSSVRNIRDVFTNNLKGLLQSII